MPLQSTGIRSALRSPVLVAAIMLCVLLTGCASRKKAPDPIAAATDVVESVSKNRLFGVMPVYRADNQQGNFISKEMVEQLKVGMTPDQVRFLMGTPLLMDVFHGNRWDYPFRLKKGNGEITNSHVVVFFENGRVARFEGIDLPAEKDYLMRIAAPKK